MKPFKAPISPFTMVPLSGNDKGQVFGDFEQAGSAHFLNLDTQLNRSIRDHHPGMTVTTTNSYPNILGYAAAGYAEAHLDETDPESLLRWRYYLAPSLRGDYPSQLSEIRYFAKYKYLWKGLEFIVYSIRVGYYSFNYILFPPDSDETVMSLSKATDALLKAAGDAQTHYLPSLYVYDSGWYMSRKLYLEVQKASWDDVILDERKKHAMTDVVLKFFDNEQRYKELDVPWKVSWARSNLFCLYPPS